MLTDRSRIATSGNTTFTRNTAEGDGGETGEEKGIGLPLPYVALNEGSEGLALRSIRVAARFGHSLFGWRSRAPEPPYPTPSERHSHLYKTILVVRVNLLGVLLVSGPGLFEG